MERTIESKRDQYGNEWRNDAEGECTNCTPRCSSGRASCPAIWRAVGANDAFCDHCTGDLFEVTPCLCGALHPDGECFQPMPHPAEAICTVCGETFLDANGLRHADQSSGHEFNPAFTDDSFEALRDENGDDYPHVPGCGCTPCTGGRHNQAPLYYAESVR